MSRVGESAPQKNPDFGLRAMHVLELLATMEQPASLLAVAEAANLTKTSAYRALRGLQDEGYVDHAGRAGYRIGSRSIALASLIGPRPALLQRARPVLARLAELSAETTTLHLRSGDHRVLVLGAEAAGSMLRCRVMVGERAPLTSGCSGTAILAHLPEAEAEHIVTVHTRPRQRKELARQLDEIRAQGYAMSFSANHPGLNGIGCALLDPADGNPLGSISVAGFEQHLTEAKLRKLIRPLRAACADLAPKLAVVIGPNSSLRLDSLDVTIQDFLEP